MHARAESAGIPVSRLALQAAMSLSPSCSNAASAILRQFGMLGPGLEEPAMFMLPAYDPTAIAIAGIGILAAAALAFGF